MSDSQFDPTGGYQSRGAVFCRYRPASVVWSEFVAWWGHNHPGKPLPDTHNLTGLTGLSYWQIRRVSVAPTASQAHSGDEG